MAEYFLKQKSLGANVKAELDLSNYAAKVDIKNKTGFDTSDFAKKQISDMDKLGIDKLKNGPSGLSSLKSKIDKLGISKLETTPADFGKLSDVAKNEVLQKTEYNELVKNVNSFQTTDASNLVKETDYNTKINETENKINDHDHTKYITIQEFNELTSENFTTILAQGNLASKNDIANFVKKADFDDKLKNLNKKVTLNKTKHELVEN